MNKLKFTALLALLFTAIGAHAQLLYKIEGNGLKAPSYIFGTHHLAPLSVIDSMGARAPFESCSQVVGEIDMTQNQMAMAMAMQPHMLAPADSTLSKVIPADKFPAVAEAFRKLAPMPGMQIEMLEPMKPMVVTSMVAVGLSKESMPDFDPTAQLDSWFQTTGKEQGKQIVPLETIDRQAAILYDTTPIAEQAEALVELLLDPDKAAALALSLTEAYMAQDLEKMMGLSKEEYEPGSEFEQALVARRNADWLTRLPAIMSEAPAFIAVGALHLPGDEGVLEGLRKLGYTVTPISK